MFGIHIFDCNESNDYTFYNDNIDNDYWEPIINPFISPIYTLCPFCSLLIECGDKYCKHCGKELYPDEYCPKCGQKIKKEV